MSFLHFFLESHFYLDGHLFLLILIIYVSAAAVA